MTEQQKQTATERVEKAVLCAGEIYSNHAVVGYDLARTIALESDAKDAVVKAAREAIQNALDVLIVTEATIVACGVTEAGDIITIGAKLRAALRQLDGQKEGGE